jgi:hypothetical protein
MTKLIRVFSVRGVPVFVHWSVFAISLFLLGAAIKEIVAAAVGLASYLGVLLLHEVGHQLVAVHRRYHVARIEIYPFHGLCRFEEPEYPLDAAVIAWGGVAAQTVVAIPLIVLLKLFGYPRFWILGIPMTIFAFASLAIAALNLLPIAPLDGKLAWSYFRHRFGRPSLQRRREEKTALQALEDAVRKARQP